MKKNEETVIVIPGWVREGETTNEPVRIVFVAEFFRDEDLINNIREVEERIMDVGSHLETRRFVKK